ncbi:M15 family metallopeptidase [Lutibacter sp.]|uniref:M15 family metallopeptidase n=1 Tax=Lutibacter sp. TaxID=1925666 RepID=UPI0025C38A29|nr:M15 family metallopeptidase [Lutibacter sp.]
MFSQTSYSESSLTGNGDLNLVGEDFKLQNDAFIAFKKMQKEALKEGISIQIVSAYRSFNHQKKIWNRKYKQYILEGFSEQQTIAKIIEYSSIPGTSRHHWGTDIDIIDNARSRPKKLLIESNYTKNRIYSKLKIWMDKNASNFGFYLVYNNNPTRKGYKYEPWHYTYKPLSKKMLEEYLKINIFNFYKNSSIKGSHLFLEIFLKMYSFEHILGVNLEILN